MVLITLMTGGPAIAGEPIETMPLWRLRVRITSDTGTNRKPVMRFNRTAAGVRAMNPRSRGTFGPVPDKYDLRLLDSPSRITMLRLGIAGSKDRCVRRIELFFNGKRAFDATVPASTCEIRGGKNIEFSSTELRRNRAWTGYTLPPLPTELRAGDLERMVTGVTGSAMSSVRGISWDLAVPLTIVRTTSSMFRVSFGILIKVPPEPENSATLSYQVRLFVGREGRLRATKVGEPCCADYEPMYDAVVGQLDTALNRLTVRPVGEQDPLTFGIDALTNIDWRWEPVIEP
jgi:hypothetical protein